MGYWTSLPRRWRPEMQKHDWPSGRDVTRHSAILVSEFGTHLVNSESGAMNVLVLQRLTAKSSRRGRSRSVEAFLIAFGSHWGRSSWDLLLFL